MLYQLGNRLLPGIVLGALAGVVIGGVASAWSGQAGLGICLGGAISGSVGSAAITGAVLPLLLCRSRLTSRLAAGPLVRALAVMLALAIYFGLARLLIS
jgi:magnesium transporter